MHIFVFFKHNVSIHCDQSWVINQMVFWQQKFTKTKSYIVEVWRVLAHEHHSLGQMVPNFRFNYKLKVLTEAS